MACTILPTAYNYHPHCPNSTPLKPYIPTITHRRAAVPHLPLPLPPTMPHAPIFSTPVAAAPVQKRKRWHSGSDSGRKAKVAKSGGPADQRVLNRLLLGQVQSTVEGMVDMVTAMRGALGRAQEALVEAELEAGRVGRELRVLEGLSRRVREEELWARG